MSISPGNLCLPEIEFFCDNKCKSVSVLCNGINDCWDNKDESNCQMNSPNFEPGNLDVATSIVIPTILACVIMVAIMVFGIKKCKEWELDRISDMRRTRRIVQRLTARLREKNCRTLQKARDMRKRALLAQQKQKQRLTHRRTDSAEEPSTSAVYGGGNGNSGGGPPVYDSIGPPFFSGTSPPPTYEDALFDEYYLELFPRSQRSSRSSLGRSTHRSGLYFR